MVRSVSVNVNTGQYQNPNTSVQQELKTNSDAKNSTNKPSFGYSEESQFDKIKYGLSALTNSPLGLVGVNMLLWKVQSFVNGNILSGKINKHFTKNITNYDQLETLAKEMKNKKHKLDNVDMIIGHPGTEGKAFFEHGTNRIVVGRKETSAVFHEIGHAVIENKTKFLKKLQRGRNNYTWIALGLYTMISQRPKNVYQDKAPTPITKVKNFLNKNDWVIPLIAFSPELITEAKASQIGIKFLKEKVAEGKLDKSVFKNIKKSYLTCFSTYLFIPVSIMLIDAIRNSANKNVQKHNQRMYY